MKAEEHQGCDLGRDECCCLNFLKFLWGHPHAIPAFPWETYSAGNWERFCLGEFCAEGGLWCSCDKQEKLYKAVATFVEGNMDALPSNLAEKCVQLSSILSGRRQRRRKATGA